MHRTNATKVVMGAKGGIINGASSIIGGLHSGINANGINNTGGNSGGGNNNNGVSGNIVVVGGNNNNGNSGGSCGGPLDTLPKQFVTSMKTLFDILDDQKTGFVKLSDIEKGWQDDGCKGLPHGVIDSLRKVTPSNGLLSFERFCAGLKICLLRNQSEQNRNRSRQSIGSNNSIKTIQQSTTESSKIKSSRSPSAPLLDIENPIPNAQWTTTTATVTSPSTVTNNTATVRPNNAIQAQRALSLPQLSPDSELDIICDTIIPSDIYGPPPKPPRSSIITASTNNGMDKAEIRHALQNWQMGILMNEMDAKDKRKNSFSINRLTRGTADGGASETSGSSQIQPSQSPNNLYQKKPNIKRREPRRHTLQNGIDYNMLKRLKQFEEERDVLLQGLAAVEKAREWYLKQISNVQEKIKYLGRMGSHMVISKILYYY